jgi:hypothetical protein
MLRRIDVIVKRILGGKQTFRKALARRRTGSHVPSKTDIATAQNSRALLLYPPHTPSSHHRVAIYPDTSEDLQSSFPVSDITRPPRLRLIDSTARAGLSPRHHVRLLFRLVANTRLCYLALSRSEHSQFGSQLAPLLCRCQCHGPRISGSQPESDGQLAHWGDASVEGFRIEHRVVRRL